MVRATLQLLTAQTGVRFVFCWVFMSFLAMLVMAPVTQAQEEAQQPTVEQPKKRQDLRLYRINKDGIADRFWFTRSKARKPGCHSITKRSRLHRAVQFGYSYCRIYARKQCAPESVLSFTRDDDPTPTVNLLQGYSWFTISEHKRGERIKSWYCSNDAIPEHESDADSATTAQVDKE